MERSRCFRSIDRSRWPIVAPALVGAVVVIVLAVLTRGRGALGIDERLSRTVVGHRPALLVDIAKVVTGAGSAAVLSILAVLVAVVALAARGGPARALAPAVALGLSSAASQLVKAAVDRVRPPMVWQLVHAPGPSFPSGHATNATAFFLVCAMALPVAPVAAAGRRLALIAGATVISGLVGASRVILGVHWPTDVLAGWIVGAEVAGATAVAMVRFDRAKRSKPVGA